MNVGDVGAGMTIVVLGFAAVSKVRSTEARLLFRAQLALYGFTARRTKLVVSVLVPSSEAAVVVMVLSPTLRPAGLLAAASLLVLFTVALAYRERRRKVPVESCSCFGGMPELPLAWHMALNILLAVLTMFAAFYPDSGRPMGSRIFGYGAGAALGLCIVFAGSLYEGIAALQRLREKSTIVR